jgi:hypothetical protein
LTTWGLTYDWLDQVAARDRSYDPFFQDKCGLAHLQAYPEVCTLYEKVKAIEQDQKLVADIGKAMKCFIEIINEKVNKKFRESESKFNDKTNNVTYNSTIASAIVSRLLQINLKISSEFLCMSVRNFHHCTPYYQDPKYDDVYVLMDDYVSYATGSLGLVEDVSKFIEAEQKDQVNLADVAKFRALGSEYKLILFPLRTSVKNIITAVEHGKPLNGECEICSRK